jgi:hypothetical protein
MYRSFHTYLRFGDAWRRGVVVVRRATSRANRMEGSRRVRLRKDSVFLLASLDENGETLERVEVALS